MPVCNNPISWEDLVIGTHYSVYPKAADGDNLLFSGWYSGRGGARGPSTTVVFRTDQADNPAQLEQFQGMFGFGHFHKPDPNGVYEVRQASGHRGIMEAGEYRYCEGDADAEMDVGMAVEDGGRRRSKTRASRRTSLGRSLSRRKPSQRRRAKSRRQQRK